SRALHRLGPGPAAVGAAAIVGVIGSRPDAAVMLVAHEGIAVPTSGTEEEPGMLTVGNERGIEIRLARCIMQHEGLLPGGALITGSRRQDDLIHRRLVGP